MDKPKLNPPPDRSKSMSNRNTERPKQKNSNHGKNQSQNRDESTQTILDTLDNLKKEEKTFKDYPIRDLVKHSEAFGEYLKSQKLETNQIRKFLDAINRLKVKLTQAGNSENNNELFQLVEPEIVLLKPKLAYAAARKSAAEPLNEVMAKVIDKVHSLEDFERLVQFIESIIAYHKSAGGK